MRHAGLGLGVCVWPYGKGCEMVRVRVRPYGKGCEMRPIALTLTLTTDH